MTMNIVGGNYYCLLAGLPEISPDDKKLTLSVSDFRTYLCDYLTEDEMNIINLFFLPNDNTQILRILNGNEPDASLQTVFDTERLRDELADPVSLPAYLIKYILDSRDEEREPSNRLPETDLSEAYWKYMLSCRNSMVRRYVEFSMNVKNLLTALNCRKHHLDIEKEVIGDGRFTEMLKTSKARDFELGDDFPYVADVISLFEKDNLAEREYAIDMLYWNFLDKETTHRYFSLENVIAFMLKLMIVERWSKLSSDEGRRVFESLVVRLKNDFKFSKEFNL